MSSMPLPSVSPPSRAALSGRNPQGWARDTCIEKNICSNVSVPPRGYPLTRHLRMDGDDLFNKSSIDDGMGEEDEEADFFEDQEEEQY